MRLSILLIFLSSQAFGNYKTYEVTSVVHAWHQAGGSNYYAKLDSYQGYKHLYVHPDIRSCATYLDLELADPKKFKLSVLFLSGVNVDVAGDQELIVQKCTFSVTEQEQNKRIVEKVQNTKSAKPPEFIPTPTRKPARY